jgi:ABC-2 type transport system ATP-binding protein
VTADSGDAVIEIDGLRKTFTNRLTRTEVTAVRDVSLTVRRGEVVAFVGPNGAGKTTTLRCLAGIIMPTNGSIEIAGHTMDADPIGA